ncbi:hypothetical protein KH5H1_18670 [Corallococcus caeni]|nr:hypothetical protein KH5H1_18670 [Corallococcus sp. KH5-1]
MGREGRKDDNAMDGWASGGAKTGPLVKAHPSSAPRHLQAGPDNPDVRCGPSPEAGTWQMMDSAYLAPRTGEGGTHTATPLKRRSRTA